MKTRFALLLSMLLLIVLTACQSPAPAAETPTQEVPTQEVSESSETSAYPAPVGVNPTVPGPGSAEFLYPEIASGEFVSWEAAVAMILNGEVTRLAQNHLLQVTLDLKDGRSLVAVEPNMDDVMKVVEQCGDLCKDIPLMTE